MKNIIIALILVCGLILSYENKVFAQNNADELHFNLPHVSLLTETTAITLSKRKLSQKMTDVVYSITLVENIRKINNYTLAFSFTNMNGNTFDNFQCFMEFSSYDADKCHYVQIHFLQCENKNFFLSDNIVIPYTDIVSDTSTYNDTLKKLSCITPSKN